MRSRNFLHRIRFRPAINYKVIALGIILCILFFLAVPFTAYNTISAQYSGRIFAVKAVPEARVAIVLGSPEDNTDENLLLDRIVTAAELYKTGTIQKVLINDSYGRSADAIEGMAIRSGIRQFDLRIETTVSGIYNSCTTSRNKYGIDKAILVTQERNMVPALYACNSVGIDSTGVIADRQLYLTNSAPLAHLAKVVDIFWNIYVKDDSDIAISKATF